MNGSLTMHQPLALWFEDDEERWIALPHDLMMLPAESGDRALVAFGHAGAAARVRRLQRRKNQRPANVIALSRGLAHALQLPSLPSLHVAYDRGTIRLGPFIGIVTSGGAERLRGMLMPFRRIGRGMAFAAFDAEGIDWQSLTVSALVAQEEGVRRMTVPLPDVLYNKIPSRRAERRLETGGFFDRLYALSRAPIVNETYFQKWDVYLTLLAYPEVRPGLPETIYAPDPVDIAHLLARYHLVYLKPEGGSKGRGIVRLERSQRGLVARYYRGVRPVAKRVRSLGAFLHRHFPGERLKTYVAQQGIRLIEEDGRPVDFRLHLSKGSTDRWETLTLAAKIAGTAGVTTHLAYGGTTADAKRVLSAHFGDRAPDILRTMIDYGRTVGEKLEHAYGRPLIELGLDLGVDPSGHVWLFEANAKPGQAVLCRISGLKTTRLKRLVNAMARLAGFEVTIPRTVEEGWP
ncbi:MAG: YheC/YheD family protein [Hydrogenibacillus sp.]|nr:YheC/YheD family protein [Hydrogenibacillus sp.]